MNEYSEAIGREGYSDVTCGTVPLPPANNRQAIVLKRSRAVCGIGRDSFIVRRG